jgi:hypothetical protein
MLARTCQADDIVDEFLETPVGGRNIIEVGGVTLLLCE